MKRCTATKTIHGGQEIRCEGEAGHDSAHYGDHLWWANDAGFPQQPHRPLSLVLMLLFLGGAILTALLLAFVVRAH